MTDSNMKYKKSAKELFLDPAEDRPFDSAEEMQDEIFQRMSPEKKLKLVSDFSMFILRSRKSAESHGFSKTNNRGRQNPR